MELKPAAGVATGYSVIAPLGVILPMRLARRSTNHTLPSGPGAMPCGWSVTIDFGTVSVYSVIAPLSAIFPILLVDDSVNQRLPSGPAVMPHGRLPAVGIVYSVTTPAGVILPTYPLLSTNHTLPSGPLAIPITPGVLP